MIDYKHLLTASSSALGSVIAPLFQWWHKPPSVRAELAPGAVNDAAPDLDAIVWSIGPGGFGAVPRRVREYYR